MLLSSQVQDALIEIQDEYVLSVGMIQSSGTTHLEKKSITRDQDRLTVSPVVTTKRNWEQV